MQKDHMRFDINYWNLDGLKIRKRSHKGNKPTHIQINDGKGPIKRICVQSFPDLTDKVLLLRPKGMIQCFDPDNPKNISKLRTWSKDYVDMGLSGEFLLLLDRAQQRIESFYIENDELVPHKVWDVGALGILPTSKIVVDQSQGKSDIPPRIAYLSGCREGRIFQLILDDLLKVSKIEPEISVQPNTLGKELSLCLDDANGSLIVSDTTNHRIVEIKLADRKADVLCGTGSPGVAKEGESALHANLESPKAVMLYRHRDFIDDAQLADDFRGMFTYDPVRPRAIIFVDSGHPSIKKLVEYPAQAELYNIPLEPAVFTLLSGPSSAANPSVLPDPERAYRDLREYPVLKPIDLAATQNGELLVCSEVPPSLVLLRPATSQPEKTLQQHERNSGVKVNS
jgi:hypothetical protein